MHEGLGWLHQIWQGLHTGQVPQLGVWSYVLVGLLVATEGPLTTLVAAAAAAAGLMDVRLVLLVTAVGNITGDAVWYSVGHAGKAGVLERSPKWLGVTQEHIDRLEHEMRTHAVKLIVIAKIAYGLMIPTLLAAGIARVRWRRWFPTVFVVETLWSALLVWTGYHAAGLLGEFERGIRIVGIVGLLVVLTAAVFFIAKRRSVKPSPQLTGRKAQLMPVVQSARRSISVEWNNTAKVAALATVEIAASDEALTAKSGERR